MLKSERGSITVFTLTVMLFFVIILMGVFIATNNVRKTQETADTTIIDKYQKDINLVNEIYNEKKLKNQKINKTNDSTIVWNSNEITYTDKNTATITAQITIEDENADLSLCKFIVNNDRNFIGENSNKWESSDAIEITSLSGKIQTIVSSEKTYYIHVLIVKEDGTKIENISSALRIEEADEEIETL